MSAPSDIDPDRLNVEPERKRRRRKKRNVPPPSPSVKAAEAKTLARIVKRPVPPGIMLEPTDDSWQVASPHSDPDLFDMQIADCFGTRSISVMRVFTQDLINLCPTEWDSNLRRWKASEYRLNAALAMVADIQPRNTAEAALAAQMVAMHWMQMKLSKDALNDHGMVIGESAALAAKLSRTYAQLLGALHSLRGRRRSSTQKITVHKTLRQEVHYHDNRPGDHRDSGTRPLESPTTIAGDCQEVRGDDEGGDIVPLRRAEGPR